MYKSQVPIVEFFEQMLPGSRAVGYKLVLTMLAREADSPSLYEDVGRYWTSLHDATGPDILFVFAGANAATRLGAQGIPDRREPVMYLAEDAAVGWGARGRPTIYWSGSSYRRDMTWGPGRKGHSEIESSRRLLRGGTPRLYGQDFAEDHTSEIGALRRYLGLRESQIPCLVFTVLGPSAGLEERIIVPLSVIRSTVYQYVKELSEFLEDALETIDKAREPLKRFKRIRQVRQSVREEAGQLESEESREAALRILELTDGAGRSTATRAECYQQLRIVRDSSGGGAGICWPPARLISRLQKAIDLSFHESVMLFSCDSHGINLENQVWTRLVADLRQFNDSRPANVDHGHWDFFVAYSSADRHVAERIHSELAKIGRTFLDTRCVRPGDRWAGLIHTAQGDSRSTVLVITANTPSSWFFESEYLRAIQLARTKGHIVVPVLYGKGALLPYGLEQVQSAAIRDWRELATLPEMVQHIVAAP
ncbi:TIR domain-containing protein [Streptomyces sp. NPDC023998]|uniref:toll/interleukin-1 receptor domain-containing protein n=1 Tax=Streptomyces sp. NPDC023998 TaxID=3154597 RepID=UPI0033D5BDEA